MRMLFALALFALPAAADRESDLTAANCMREYYAQLSGGGSFDHLRDRLIPVMKTMSPKVHASVVRQLNKGFDKKYDKDNAYLSAIAQTLAAGGKGGIATLYRRFKAEGKRDDVRQLIAEALGGCGDEDALDTLEKMMYDAAPGVAAAAITGMGSYGKVDEKARKETCKALVKQFGKVTDKAAGKDPEGAEMKYYLALKGPFNATLKAFTGQELDSAAAWDAWLRENITQPWAG